jgi:hypothetical protein
VRRRWERNPVGIPAKIARAVMAFEAQRKYLRAAQKPRVHAAVRRMTRAAAIDAYGGVFENKGPAFVYMALETGLFILQAVRHHSGPGHHPGIRGVGAMGIMAIRALHEAFIDPVFDGHRELRANVGVALVAKIGLRFGEEVLRRRGLMNRMTVRADHIGRGMRTATNVCAPHLRLMTTQAVIQGGLRAQGRERNDL